MFTDILRIIFNVYITLGNQYVFNAELFYLGYWKSSYLFKFPSMLFKMFTNYPCIDALIKFISIHLIFVIAIVYGIFSPNVSSSCVCVYVKTKTNDIVCNFIAYYLAEFSSF